MAKFGIHTLLGSKSAVSPDVSTLPHPVQDPCNKAASMSAFTALRLLDNTLAAAVTAVTDEFTANTCVPTDWIAEIWMKI